MVSTMVRGGGVVSMVLLAMAMEVFCGRYLNNAGGLVSGRRPPPFRRAPCPVPRLRNGKIKLKQNGRLARFQCFTNYLLAGTKSIYCDSDGKWESPIPHCVRVGCRDPRMYLDGSSVVVFGELGGALVRYYCRPGLVMRGADASYCDGRSWSDPPPECGAKPTSGAAADADDGELACDFEEGWCGLRQHLNHDVDWKRVSWAEEQANGAVAPSGPRLDHTTDARTGHYLQVLSTGNEADGGGAFARLLSPLFSPGNTTACLSVWLDSRGPGSVWVLAKPQSATYQDTRAWKQLGALLTQQEQSTGTWRRKQLTVAVGEAIPLGQPYQLVVEARLADGKDAAISLDDLRLTPGECLHEDATMSSTTEYWEMDANVGTCEGRCGEDSYGTEAPCACTVGCAESGTCCVDYIVFCVIFDFDDTEQPSSSITSPVTTEVTKTFPTTTSMRTTTKPTTQKTITSKPTTRTITRPTTQTTTKPTTQTTTTSKPTTRTTRKKITYPTTTSTRKPPTTTVRKLQTRLQTTATVSFTKSTSASTRLFLFTTTPVTRQPTLRASVATTHAQQQQQQQQETDARSPRQHLWMVGCGIGSLVVIVLGATFAVWRCRRGRRLQGAGSSDSFSDVRFLTSDEQLDFRPQKATDL